MQIKPCFHIFVPDQSSAKKVSKILYVEYICFESLDLIQFGLLIYPEIMIIAVHFSFLYFILSLQGKMCKP